ncbi:hypothetical protein DSECCO2_393220 [anaerobic digester metagenome]
MSSLFSSSVRKITSLWGTLGNKRTVCIGKNLSLNFVTSIKRLNGWGDVSVFFLNSSNPLIKSKVQYTLSPFRVEVSTHIPWAKLSLDSSSKKLFIITSSTLCLYFAKKTFSFCLSFLIINIQVFVVEFG